ncbi:MAG TPA: sigma-70 family RNA polymerase sigma factor [Bryobacteraceae bacterium]|nr:sigma-70 family RNA polymerase sigma factor [Bryobacteraceae bacterium]
MKSPQQHEITRLLRAWSDGQQTASEELMPLVYEELHRLARVYMGREREGHTLQATGLVHETYLRLIEASSTSFEDRAHFFGMCALLMRRILVDWARSRGALKRGADQRPVQLEEALVVSPESEVDLVALDDALKALEVVDARKSRVVELRYFGGLSVEESAQVLHVSAETVMRDWKLAKSWLRRELSGGKTHGA